MKLFHWYGIEFEAVVVADSEDDARGKLIGFGTYRGDDMVQEIEPDEPFVYIL